MAQTALKEFAEDRMGMKIDRCLTDGLIKFGKEKTTDNFFSKCQTFSASESV